MGLDIRLPIGLMFTTFGLLLAGFGLLSDKSIYTRSLGINVNIGWGLVLLAFGAVMLMLGIRQSRTRDSDSARDEVAKAEAAGANTRSHI